MGGYYARAEGLPDAVADAIRDHYKPVGQGDDVPTASVTVAVSLADKLDTLVGFFGIQERPTGSRDPFALRRAALGVLQILLQNGIRLGTETTVMRSVKGFVEQWNYYGITEEESAVADTRLKEFNLTKLFADVFAFFADRLKTDS